MNSYKTEHNMFSDVGHQPVPDPEGEETNEGSLVCALFSAQRYFPEWKRVEDVSRA